MRASRLLNTIPVGSIQWEADVCWGLMHDAEGYPTQYACIPSASVSRRPNLEVLRAVELTQEIDRGPRNGSPPTTYLFG